MKTQIETISKYETKIVINNFSCSLANSLRRIMIGEIPTISIDLVSIEINSSLICDEFLSHRLGLIPLKSNSAQRMKFTRECECDNYCSKCSSIFNLNVRSTNPDMKVYSTHLNNLDFKEDFLGNCVIPIHDSGSDVKFSYSPILIAKLKTGQQIKLLGVAKKGTGLDHSKWCPVSVLKLKTEPIFYRVLVHLVATDFLIPYQPNHVLGKVQLQMDLQNDYISYFINDTFYEITSRAPIKLYPSDIVMPDSTIPFITASFVRWGNLTLDNSLLVIGNLPSTGSINFTILTSLFHPYILSPIQNLGFSQNHT